MNDEHKEQLVRPIRNQLNVHGQNGNWNHDPYMHGMYNGLECALATLEGREPQYRSAPAEWLKDRTPPGYVPTVCEVNNEPSSVTQPDA